MTLAFVRSMKIAAANAVIGLAFLFLTVHPQPANAADKGVTLIDIRLVEGRTPQTVVLDLTGPAKVRLEPGTANLSFKISGVHHKKIEQRAHPANPYFSGVSLAPSSPGRSMLSFKNKQPFKAIAYTLPPDRWGGHRIVIQLKPGMAVPGGRNPSAGRPMSHDTKMGHAKKPMIKHDTKMMSKTTPDTMLACYGSPAKEHENKMATGHSSL